MFDGMFLFSKMTPVLTWFRAEAVFPNRRDSAPRALYQVRAKQIAPAGTSGRLPEAAGKLKLVARKIADVEQDKYSKDGEMR